MLTYQLYIFELEARLAAAERKLAKVREACVYQTNLIGRPEEPVFTLRGQKILDILNQS